MQDTEDYKRKRISYQEKINTFEYDKNPNLDQVQVDYSAQNGLKKNQQRDNSREKRKSNNNFVKTSVKESVSKHSIQEAARIKFEKEAMSAIQELKELKKIAKQSSQAVVNTGKKQTNNKKAN